MYYYRIHVSGKLESAAICAILGDEEARSFLERAHISILILKMGF